MAEAEMGYLYENGKGVPLDFAKAVDWYTKSADQDSADGEAALGSMYYYGRGVPVDHAAAWNLYSKAAAQGNSYAENALGILLQRGIGTTQSYAQALVWYRKAADQHYATAEYNLGKMYWYGYGVPPDRQEAYRWIRKAADDGDENAQRFLSMGLSPPSEFRLLILFAFGLYCVSGFVPTNHWSQTTRAHGRELKVSIAIGAFCIFSAAYSWYGYTHYLMRRLGAGMNAFTAGRWIMDAGVVLFLVYIMRSGKKRENNEIENKMS